MAFYFLSMMVLSIRIYWLWLGLAFMGLFHPEFLVFEDFYNQKRIVQLVVFFVTFLFLFNKKIFENYLRLIVSKKKVVTLVLVFFAAGIISVLSSDFSLHSIQDWLNLLVIFLLVPLFALLISEDKKGFNYFLFVLLFSASLYIFKFNFVLVLASIFSGTIKGSVLVSGVVNVNFIAQPLGLLAPFFLVYGYYSTKFKKILNSSLFFLTLILMFVIDNRGVLVSFSILSIFWSVWEKKWRFFLYFFGLFTFAFAIYYLIVLSIDVVGVDKQVKKVFDSADRDVLWIQSWKMFIANPLFGQGPYSFTFQTPISGTAHPHNFYLQILSEWGLISFLALSLLFFIFVSRAVKILKRKPTDLIIAASFLSLIEGILHSGLSGVLIMPVSQTIFIVFISLIISASIKPTICLNKQRVTGFYYSTQILFFIFILFIFSAFLILIFINSLFYGENCILNVGPRFWVDGGIASCESIGG